MAYTRKQLRAMKVQDINDKIVAACAAIAEDLEGGDIEILGESDTDEIRLVGKFTSRNNADSSMYVPVDAASTTPYGFRYAIDVASSPGLGSGYLNAGFFNARASSDGDDSITGTIRGSESKATVYQCNMGNSSYAVGAYGKVSVSSSPAQVDYGAALHGYIENSGANTSITNAYGCLVEAASPLSSTTANAFAAKDVTGGTFKYGLNLDSCTNLTAEIVGQNSETIDNATNGYWNFGTGKVIGTGNYGSGAGMSTPLLNTAFGSPTTVGGGFRAVYRDTSGNKTYHVCVCTGIDGWFAYEASPVAGS